VLRIQNRFCGAVSIVALTLTLALAGAAQNPPAATAEPLYTFKVESDLVLVNVIARDKHGNLIRDLKASDFTLSEEGKPQGIVSFDLEDSGHFATSPEQRADSTPVSATILTAIKPDVPSLRDRRLIVLFFDFMSMEPVDAQRAIDVAQEFVDKQMTPADVVAIASYATAYSVAQDFTTDHAALTAALKRLSAADGQGGQDVVAGNIDTLSNPDNLLDTTADYAPDTTDFNIFNTDMELRAIDSLATALAGVPQRKEVLYFSGGLSKNGIDNQAQLNRAINTAVRSNVALYAVDIRGLQTLIPGGDASKASQKGTAAFSGAATKSAFDKKLASEETLFTLSKDTGGKAFLDSNDFGKAFTTVQNDTATYYELGYRSGNHAKDGAYRRISVRVKRPGVKLDFRPGYYTGRDWGHLDREGRKTQLQQEITSSLPDTDLPVHVGTAFFRLSEDRYFLAASVVVPGSAIPFIAAADKDKADLDILGVVSNKQTKTPVQMVQQTVPLVTSAAQQARRSNIQYETGFVLGPGVYLCKFVVRENQTGKLGSFVHEVTIPDLKKESPKISSVVLSQQPGANPQPPNPLPLTPNVAHVFAAGLPLYVYYEVYEPADKPAVKLLTTVQLFRDNRRVYEAPPVTVKELNSPGRKAAIFQVEVPTLKLTPGRYTCQVNVIDDTGNSYGYSRVPLAITEAK
jgi:VWFA-related protein